MSTATLTNLRDYLYDTLTPANMEENKKSRPYTMKEIDEMLDEAEAAFEAGDYLTNDEVFHRKMNAVTV